MKVALQSERMTVGRPRADAHCACGGGQAGAGLGVAECSRGQLPRPKLSNHITPDHAFWACEQPGAQQACKALAEASAGGNAFPPTCSMRAVGSGTSRPISRRQATSRSRLTPRLCISPSTAAGGSTMVRKSWMQNSWPLGQAGRRMRGKDRDCAEEARRTCSAQQRTACCKANQSLACVGHGHKARRHLQAAQQGGELRRQLIAQPLAGVPVCQRTVKIADQQCTGGGGVGQHLGGARVVPQPRGGRGGRRARRRRYQRHLDLGQRGVARHGGAGRRGQTLCVEPPAAEHGEGRKQRGVRGPVDACTRDTAM